MKNHPILYFAALLCPLIYIASGQPNIVFIMADDLGPGDVSRQHEERTGRAALAATPTLDAWRTRVYGLATHIHRHRCARLRAMPS